MRPYDLIIVGAGMVGVSCAAVAAAEGLRVAIVEKGTPGGGVTAASMGHLVAMDGSAVELALTSYSLRLWEMFPDRAAAGFNRCGTLWVARDDDEQASIGIRLTRLAVAGIVAQRIDAASLHELEPALARDMRGGMLVPEDAAVYPPDAVRCMLKRARARGADLHAGTVIGLQDHGVKLDGGGRLCGPVLVAAGGALPSLLPQLPLQPRKGHLVISQPYPGTLRHQVLELGYASSAHGGAQSSVAFNVQPRPGGQILIGSSRETGIDNHQVSTSTLQRMLQRAFEYMPALRQMQATRVWTGLRPATPDGQPYLGAVPDHRDVWVAAGHEGLGITSALGSARLVVDLMLGRMPGIDPAPYSPQRLS